MKHIVVFQQRYRLLDVLTLLVFFDDLQGLPKHNDLCLFTLADAAASLSCLLEGYIFAGLRQKHLVEEGIRSAGDAAVSPGTDACPGTHPRDAALFQFSNDAVGDDLIDVDGHGIYLLIVFCQKKKSAEALRGSI